MPARFQLKRTKKKYDNAELDKHSLKFGEPLYFDSEDKQDVALVIGDGKNTPIRQLPRFMPTPPDTEDVSYNNVYYTKEGDKYYLIDKDGNKISIIGSGGGGSSISIYKGTLLADSWTSQDTYFTQDVSLPSVLEKNPATIDVSIDNVSEYIDILSNWKYIIKAQTYNGGVKFYAYDTPSIDLAFKVQAISENSETLSKKEATITTTWTSENNYYVQEIVVDGVTGIDSSTIDLIVDMSNYKQQLQQWGKIIKIDTEEGKIKVYASEQTTIELPIQMFVYTLTDNNNTV